MLEKCPTISTAMPVNDIGALLLDYNDAAAIGGGCIARQHILVDYLAPIVTEEKARVAPEPK